MDIEVKGCGKIVDNLTVEDFREYEKQGILILLVRNPLSDEVQKVVSESSVYVYADLSQETIEAILQRVRIEEVLQRIREREDEKN